MKLSFNVKLYWKSDVLLSDNHPLYAWQVAVEYDLLTWLYCLPQDAIILVFDTAIVHIFWMACWLCDRTEQLILKSYSEKVTVLCYSKTDSYALE